TLEGFGDTKERSVSLQAVNKSGEVSEEITETFTPLEPPYKTVRETLNPRATFGGIILSFENKAEANIKISMFMEDGGGELSEVEGFYSKAKESNFSVRGLDTLEVKFGFTVSDR